MLEFVKEGVMEEIKRGRLFLYNLSSAGHALFDNLLNFYYAIFLLPPAEKIAAGMKQYIPEQVFFGVFTVLGIIMIFARFIDGFADPFIGYFSDHSRSKLGRRRVFMLAATIPLAVSTALIFFPPVPEISYINVIFYAVVFGSCFLFYTMYVAPYIALIPELGHTEKKRVSITTTQGYCALAGGLISMIGGPWLISLGEGMGMGITHAYQFMAVIMGVTGAILLMLAVLGVDEKRYSNAKPVTTPFFKSIKITLGNSAFIIFMLANMTLWFVFNTVRSSLNHVTITLVKGNEGDAGIYFIVIFGSAAAFFMLVWYLVRKIGKKNVMMLGLGLFAVLGVLLALTGIIPVPPGVWVIVVFALIGFPVAVFLIVPNVFISEVCDLDYQKTGIRREAMYFGVHGFFQTFTLGLSAAALAFFYSAFGKDIANPLGVRLTLLFAAAIALAGFFIIQHYPGKQKT